MDLFRFLKKLIRWMTSPNIEKDSIWSHKMSIPKMANKTSSKRSKSDSKDQVCPNWTNLHKIGCWLSPEGTVLKIIFINRLNQIKEFLIIKNSIKCSNHLQNKHQEWNITRLPPKVVRIRLRTIIWADWTKKVLKKKKQAFTKTPSYRKKS